MKLFRLLALIALSVLPAFAQKSVTVNNTTNRLMATNPAVVFPPTSLKLDDTNASHQLTITVGSDLTAARTFTLIPGDANRSLTFTGDATLNQDVSTAGSPTFQAGAISATAITPATEWEVVSTGTSSPRGIMSAQYNTGTDGARFHMRKARGTRASPATVVTGDNLGRLVASGYDGANFLEMASIVFSTEGTVAATRIPTTIVFQTATDAAPSVLTTALTINSAQQVLIASGTTAKPAFSFAAAPTTGMYLSSGAIAFSLGGVINTYIESSGRISGAQGSNTIAMPSTGAITITADGTNQPVTISGQGTGAVIIKGTGTNDAAAAGKVGELLSAQLAAASTTALSTATGKTITSVSLTAGDWEVSGVVAFVPANTTTVTNVVASVSGTDNTQGSVDSVGGYVGSGVIYTSTGNANYQVLPPLRLSLASTTTYYLVATATFGVSTCTGYGTIRARRMR